MRMKVCRLIDALDALSVRIGLSKAASWSAVRSGKVRKLYAGRLSRQEPQFSTHLGITPFAPSSRNIAHDLTKPFPIGDQSIDVFQSSDVFEHIELDKIPALIDEIYRVLVPGGLFRLSVPDYRSSIYLERTLRAEDGRLLFDPGGGGRLHDGRIVDGGHVWFPIFETIKGVMQNSQFGRDGQIDYLHYHGPDGAPVVRTIDYSKGFILRTPDHDRRARLTGKPLSIVVDARKAIGPESAAF